MATEQKRILFRRGNKADLVVTDLQPGEPIMALDQDAPGVKGNGGNVIWSATLDSNGDVKQDPASYGKANGGATLDANQKVAEDPASYGKANGGAVLPPTLPTSPVIPQLNGGVLSAMTLPAKGTWLMVGDNNVLVAATEQIESLAPVNFSNYGGTYLASVAGRMGNRVELRGMLSSSASSVSAGTIIASISSSSLHPTVTQRFIVMGVNGTTPAFVAVDVTTTGNIVLQSAMTTGPWVNLCGIVYNI